MSASSGASASSASNPPARPRSGLRTPLFGFFVGGWSIANLADSLLTVILAVWIVDLTGNIALGGITFVFIGAPALLSPFFGDLADRMSRRTLLICAYAGGALSLVPLFWVVGPEDIWIVYAVTFIYASVSYVSGACQSGLLRDLLRDEELGSANGIFSTIDQVLRVGLPFVGAALYVFTGMHVLVATSAAAFASAAIIFLVLPLPEVNRRAERDPYFRSLGAGFRHLISTAPLNSMSTAMIIVMTAIGAVNGIAFAIVDNLGLPASWLGPLMAGQGVGGVLAGIFAPRLLRRIGRVTTFAAGVIALGISVVALAGQSVSLVVASQLILGFAVTTVVIAFVTERQIATQPALQGRVAAASHVIMNLPTVIGTVAATSLIAVCDFRVLVLTAAAIVTLVGIVALIRRPRTSTVT